MLVLEENSHLSRLKGWWSKTVETFVTPERSGGGKCITEYNLHARIEATS
jgi:hypothetical protein